jgi:glycosyltransferase involved in cell wall biosynthesis
MVSFILPTLNAECLLRQCLESVRRQDYPADRYEILVADGGSTDRTVEIAKSLDCTLIDAGGMMAEAAKSLAFAHAKGTYLALIDTDNEITETSWLTRAITALERHPDAMGFESYYFKHPSDTHLNAYLTGLLQISDPCARIMASPLKLIAIEPDGAEIFRLPANGAYPTGANGFIFPRSHLEKMPDGHSYHEAAFFPALMRLGITKLLKIPGLGVHHHYVNGWSDFLKKRRRAMIIYMLRKQEIRETWDQAGLHTRKLFTILYASSFIGPLLEGSWRAMVQRDPDWLLHPFACAVSVLGNVWGIVDFRRLDSSDERASMSRRLGPGEGHKD